MPNRTGLSRVGVGLVGVILTCAVLYIGESKWSPIPWFALSPASSTSTSSGASRQTQSAGASAVDVPDSVVSQLVHQLGPILGTSDDMTVLPTDDGTGYVVTVTVNLGVSDRLSVAQWLPTAVKDVPEFFTRLYSSGVDVVDGQLYFMHGGSIVGGSGLGRSAYTALAAETATTNATFVSVLSSTPQVTAPGSAECWIQMVNTAPSVALQQPG